MAVKIPHYRVLLAAAEHPDDVAQAVEHEIYVLHGDQLRAELEAPRNGIPAMDQAPMHNITLWIWAALMRTHVIDQAFQEFRSRLLGFDEIKPGDPAGGGPTPGDPTQPAPLAGSLSSSPASSATSAGGSTPTPIPGSSLQPLT